MKVDANPTKAFFVSSLTRDIELKDAILDLLDNCIDGIMRSISSDNTEGNRPYEGFEARITAHPEVFSIKDNCGGIPKKDALEKAFRFGRPDSNQDGEIPTVGMYGIGMKRALFKIGKDSVVESSNAPDHYKVEIPESWLTSESWDLELEELPYDKESSDGTSITVNNLYPGISRQFDDSNSDFLQELHDTISQNFALIIRKGFKVYLNDIEIEGVEFRLLAVEDFEDSSASINPYIYKAEVEEVEVSVVIGFYHELSSLGEREDDDNVRRSRRLAGITVICNDRVVLYKDKTRKTGWGVDRVPAFHNQFISIAGVVTFKSNSSEKLPLTTTKRGIDMEADVYWDALEYVKKGLKKFTSFTNAWKGREREVKAAFSETSRVDGMNFSSDKIDPVLRKVPRKENEYQYIPKLPMPERQRDTVRISYTKLKDEVNALKESVFGNEDITPSKLGEWCFDQQMRKIK
jgi:hypothetical protein